MKNRDKNVKNKLAYFYTVIKNMDTKDSIKQSKINKHEIPLDEVMYDNFSENFDMDKHVLEQDLLGWFELIEDENLHKAVKNLSIEDQIFISYIVKECRTQRELSQIYKINQRTVGRRFEKILNNIRIFLYKK